MFALAMVGGGGVLSGGVSEKTSVDGEKKIL